MMHKAWSSIEEVPYCFSRSYVKLQGHTAQKIIDFDPNWAFPDSNSSFNSPMAMKCCTMLETAKERCPIVFQGHPSNFKVTRDKTSPNLTQIGRFRTIGWSQLSNPSDLPCFPKYTWDTREVARQGEIWSEFTVWCIYNIINFLLNPHNRHTIVPLWWWDMKCLLWAPILIYVLSQLLQCCMQYHFFLDYITRACHISATTKSQT